MTDLKTIEHLETVLRRLLRGEHSSLIIGFNEEHAPNYQTAKEWHDRYGEYGGGDDHGRINWVSEEERRKAIENNSVWSCQWYPNTPVGFCCLGASSLTALIIALEQEVEE